MKLTTELLNRFVGGQMEIQNKGERYLYRGEIATIAMANDELQAEFAWFAKGEGGFPIPREWVADERRDYAITLEMCSVSDIGPSGDEVGGDNRLLISSLIIGEDIVLYPPNGSKLDPAKVRGLRRD